MARFVALYRAINVGKRRITMDRLRAVHTGIGHADVETHLASGNVLFETDEKDLEETATRLQDALEEEVGWVSEVLIRDADQLQSSIDRNPFLGPAFQTKFVHTAFLSAQPTPQAVRSLTRDHDGPEDVYVDGWEVFVHYAQGSARSRLKLDRLGVVWTGRNANTVATLLEKLER